MGCLCCIPNNRHRLGRRVKMKISWPEFWLGFLGMALIEVILKVVVK